MITTWNQEDFNKFKQIWDRTSGQYRLYDSFESVNWKNAVSYRLYCNENCLIQKLNGQWEGIYLTFYGINFSAVKFYFWVVCQQDVSLVIHTL